MNEDTNEHALGDADGPLQLVRSGRPYILLDVRTSATGLKGEITMSSSLFDELVTRAGRTAFHPDDVAMMLHIKDSRVGPERGEIRYSMIHLAFGVKDEGWVGEEPPDFDDTHDALYPRAAEAAEKPQKPSE